MSMKSLIHLDFVSCQKKNGEKEASFQSFKCIYVSQISMCFEKFRRLELDHIIFQKCCNIYQARANS